MKNIHKRYLSLGLMSGTSGDGVDASLIYSNGLNEYESIKDKYFEYDNEIYKSFHNIKDKINNKKDLKKLNSEILDLERKITIFHAKVIKDLNLSDKDFLIGFHGQTLYHNSKEKISLQLGDAKLLFQLIKKKIVSKFRNKDILNGGEGAPFTPIFHHLIGLQKKIELPICFLNIGGISNITIVRSLEIEKIFSRYIGPGNCLIDNWVRKNSKLKYDQNGKLAMIGKRNDIFLEQAQELYNYRKNKTKISFDVNDFDISFARGLSLEDGARTLTDFTTDIICDSLITVFSKLKIEIKNILLCGGGRKNKFLITKMRERFKSKINFKMIDNYEIDGDFVESQAFAFLAIRSYKNIPISYPNTTGCNKPTVGGEIIEN